MRVVAREWTNGTGAPQEDVADLVKSWSPDHIVTLGDNNYDDGAAATIDANIGQYFYGYSYPYRGSYGAGATTNRFWPSLGNHDYHTEGARPYLDYCTLPGNERYYEFRVGPMHFFALNSNRQEPDGNTRTSVQANWLRNALAASNAPWKVVYFHHAPYTSGGEHGNSGWMQWPFQDWAVRYILVRHGMCFS